MVHIDSWHNSLSITKEVATVNCWVRGYVGEATRAKVIAELQEKNGNSWKTISTWTNTQDDFQAYVYGSKSVTPDMTYRVKSTVTVWEGNKSASNTTYSEEKKCVRVE